MISAPQPAKRLIRLPLPSRQFSATQRRNSGSDSGCIVHCGLTFWACGPFGPRPSSKVPGTSGRRALLRNHGPAHPCFAFENHLVGCLPTSGEAWCKGGGVAAPVPQKRPGAASVVRRVPPDVAARLHRDRIGVRAINPRLIGRQAPPIGPCPQPLDRLAGWCGPIAPRSAGTICNESIGERPAISTRKEGCGVLSPPCLCSLAGGFDDKDVRDFVLVQDTQLQGAV